MKHVHFLTATAVAGAALTMGACTSSGSGADVSAPAVSAIRQNSTIDPTGSTVDVIFGEPVEQTEAELPTNYTASAGNILSATLQPDLRTVRLVLDQLVVPGDVTFGVAAGTAATGSVAFTAQVTDGDTVTVSDGTDAITFEFTSGGGATAGNVEVDKGADAAACAAAFLAAVNGEAFGITAAAGVGNVVTLTNDEFGMIGNVAITETDAGNAITLVGLTGGGGIEDLAGNVIETAINNFALTSTDLLRPSAASVAGVTIEGPDNDRLVVVFSENMIESEVEDVANWTVEAPIGNTFDLTNATVDYVTGTRTATVTLGATVPGEALNNDFNNLQTADTLRIAFDNMRDIAGNEVQAAAVNGISDGDRTPPTLLSAWHFGADTTVSYRFSEPIKQFAFADLYSGGNDPGPRLLLNDADFNPAVAATGTIVINSVPADGDTITINDGTNTDVFEWDDNASVGGGNIPVAIALGDTDACATNLEAEIDGLGATVTVAATINGGNPSRVDLVHDTAGTAGNNATTFTGTAVTVTGLSAGAEESFGQPTPVVGGFTFEAGDTGVRMDYAPSVPDVGNDTFDFYGIQDLAGNQAFPVLDTFVDNRVNTPPQIAGGATDLLAFAGENNDEIILTFNGTMSPYFAEEPSNYSFLPALDTDDATFEFDGSNTVLITLGGDNLDPGQLYTVSIVDNAATPLRTAQGFELSANGNVAIAASGDTTGIATFTAFPGPLSSPNTCIVVFPEAVDPTGAMLPVNYEILTVNPTTVEQLTPRAYRLTFAAQPMAGQTLDVTNAGGTDLAQNPPTALLSFALGAADTTAPTATFTANAVEGQGGDFFFVDFNEEMDLTTALDADNYVFVHNGAAVSLTGATFRYDSTTQGVFIHLPATFDFTFGANTTLTMSNVRDLSQNLLAVQPAAVMATGDNVDPGFFGADSAFVNWIVDPTGRTVDVLFSEAVRESFVETPANWSTSGVSVVTSATRVAPDIARITTNVAIGTSETIGLTNLPDVAGNNGGGAITVDPLE